MKHLILLATLALHASAATATEAFEARVRQADGWVAWNVPMVSDAGAPCCFAGEHWERTSCNLDERNRGFSTSDDARRPASGTLTVYAHVARSRIDDVRAFEASCPVRSNSEIRRLGDVAATDSIGLLSSWMDRNDGARHEPALGAIAYHADDAATRVLASHAAAGHPREERENALFWLGEARGSDGASIVERFATTDDDPKLREHAIFALSESRVGDPYARIRAISQSDRDGDVRARALFWMAQMKDERAAADITAALRTERDENVREQAVFALSQLGGEKADDALIAIVRGDYPREIKKRALFWLGESGSPRAMALLDQALARPQ